MNPKCLMSLLSTLGAKQDQRIIIKLVAPLVLGRERKLWLLWKTRRTELKAQKYGQRDRIAKKKIELKLWPENR